MSMPQSENIIDHLKKAMAAELEKEFDAMCEEMFEKFQKRREEIVASWAIHLTKHMNIYQANETLIIEIRKPDFKLR